jgi:hypothetical protein
LGVAALIVSLCSVILYATTVADTRRKPRAHLVRRSGLSSGGSCHSTPIANLKDDADGFDDFSL